MSKHGNKRTARKTPARSRVRYGWRTRLRMHFKWLARQKELGLEVEA